MLNASEATSHELLSGSEVSRWLVQAGLDPKALAAAGFNAENAAAIVGNTSEYLVQNMQQIRALESQLDEARFAIRELERSATAGTPELGAAAVLQVGLQSIQSLQSQHSEQMAAIFTVATSGLDAVNVTKLSAIKANRYCGLPIEFCMQSRTDDEVVQLRDAIAARDIAARNAVAIPAVASQRIRAATTQQTELARVALDNVAGVVSAWNAAVAQITDH